jgi:hypothetical protein
MNFMGDKAKNDSERLARIIDGIEDSILNATDDEILQSAREENRNPAETSARLKGILGRAVRSQQQVELIAARAGYRRQAAAMAEATFELPKTREGRRTLFMAAMSQLPQLQPAFTLQNRDFKDLSDDDIEVQLRKMALLDLLSQVKAPEDK